MCFVTKNRIRYQKFVTSVAYSTKYNSIVFASNFESLKKSIELFSRKYLTTQEDFGIKRKKSNTKIDIKLNGEKI